MATIEGGLGCAHLMIEGPVNAHRLPGGNDLLVQPGRPWREGRVAWRNQLAVLQAIRAGINQCLQDRLHPGDGTTGAPGCGCAPRTASWRADLRRL